jgi:putative transposase/transposase-like zinc-binding protein
MSERPTVVGALRTFLPQFQTAEPALSPQQRRAIWAITHCRTAALGGRAFVCTTCHQVHFAYHSCNHKACPQCGALATRRWVAREVHKLINAPYFLVTFTLPSELRGCFFGPFAKLAYDLFFTAVQAALTEKLAADKGLRAATSGFTAVLHTWNQRLEFHPHIHCLVPGAGLNATSDYVRVKSDQFLVYLPHLQAAFRQHFYELLKKHDWQVDPGVWSKQWGVHIQPAGSGTAAVKYLGTYVARTAITDARLLSVTHQAVTFRWKDRAHQNRSQSLTLPGIEFVRRYLRHVLPRGLRSVRYYGFCHPTAKASRLRVQLHSGKPLDLGLAALVSLSQHDVLPEQSAPLCPQCGQPMQLLLAINLHQRNRGPPPAKRAQLPTAFAA